MKPKKVWTKKEEQFLIDNYGKIPIGEIAKKLNLDYMRTNAKIQYLRKAGIINRENRARGKYTKSEKINWKDKEPYILENHNKISLYKIAAKLGVKYVTLCKHMRKMREEGRLEMREEERLVRRSINTIQKTPENSIAIYEMSKLDKKMKLGKSYKILKKGSRNKFSTDKFEGELIQKTEKFYTFKNKHRAESFLKVDFVIGEYSIKEV